MTLQISVRGWPHLPANLSDPPCRWPHHPANRGGPMTLRKTSPGGPMTLRTGRSTRSRARSRRSRGADLGVHVVAIRVFKSRRSRRSRSCDPGVQVIAIRAFTRARDPHPAMVGSGKTTQSQRRSRKRSERGHQIEEKETAPFCSTSTSQGRPRAWAEVPLVLAAQQGYPILSGAGPSVHACWSQNWPDSGVKRIGGDARPDDNRGCEATTITRERPQWRVSSNRGTKSTVESVRSDVPSSARPAQRRRRGRRGPVCWRWGSF
jgi:hypothetical protein